MHTWCQTSRDAVILNGSITRAPLLFQQFVSLPLWTWSRFTLRFLVSHLIGSSPAGSGSSKKWTPASAAMIQQPAGAPLSSATWDLAKQPSLLAWWHLVVMETVCGQMLLAARPYTNVRGKDPSLSQLLTVLYKRHYVAVSKTLEKMYANVKLSSGCICISESSFLV